jgi:hypothetical protein
MGTISIYTGEYSDSGISGLAFGGIKNDVYQRLKSV